MLIKIGEPRTFEKLPEGWYEVFVNTYDKADKTNSAYESSRIKFTVRDDVEAMEEFARKNVFTNIRTSWEWMFSTIGHACGVPKDTEFEDLDEFLDGIKGLSLKVKVVHNGEYANIKAYAVSEEAEYVVPTVDNVSEEDSIV